MKNWWCKDSPQFVCVWVYVPLFPTHANKKFTQFYRKTFEQQCRAVEIEKLREGGKRELDVDPEGKLIQFHQMASAQAAHVVLECVFANQVWGYLEAFE